MTTAYRVTQVIGKYNTLVLAIDRYGDYLLFTQYYDYPTRGLVYQHKREYKGIYLHDRRPNINPNDAIQLIAGKHAPPTFTVFENSLKFRVDMDTHQDTGLFLDHEPSRLLVQESSSKKKVLNLFSYTGSFSVYAAAGGAKQTTSVDLSNSYNEWAIENLKLNGFESHQYYKYQNQYFKFLEKDQKQNNVVRANAIEFLDEAIENGLLYDIIIIDPPSFARHEKKVFSVQKDHIELITKAVAVLEKNGSILFSTNLQDFKLGKLPAEVKLKEQGRKTIPESFLPSTPHQAFMFTRSA